MGTRSRWLHTGWSRDLAIIASLFTVAVVINFLVLPGSNIVSSLFVLPILVASRAGSDRSIISVSAVAVTLYLACAILKGREPLVIPLGVVGIVVVGFLATWLARERRRTIGERERLQHFMALIAHDMGQPLTILSGQMQLLERRAQRGTLTVTPETLAPFYGATDQMRRLLGDLQDASAIGAGQFGLDVSETDIVAVVAAVLEQHRGLESGHRLVLDGDSVLTGQWDPGRLRQLFTNLISNALKYSPPGSEVRVTMRHTRTHAVARVADQGPGISLTQQEQMFIPFSRLNTSTGTQGMGLGLYIAKGIVDAHRGTISVSTEAGGGATFEVMLPLDPDLT